MYFMPMVRRVVYRTAIAKNLYEQASKNQARLVKCSHMLSKNVTPAFVAVKTKAAHSPPQLF